MKTKSILLLSVCAILLSFACFYFSFFILPRMSLIETREYYASITVANSTGFDVNGTAFTFGRVMPGSSSLRNLIFDNNLGTRVKIMIVPEGEIKKFVKSKTVFVEKDYYKKIPVVATPEIGMPYGLYDGRIVAHIYKA